MFERAKLGLFHVVPQNEVDSLNAAWPGASGIDYGKSLSNTLLINKLLPVIIANAGCFKLVQILLSAV